MDLTLDLPPPHILRSRGQVSSPVCLTFPVCEEPSLHCFPGLLWRGASPIHSSSSELRTQTVVVGFGRREGLPCSLDVVYSSSSHPSLFISLDSRDHRHPRASQIWLRPYLRTSRQKSLPGPRDLLSPRTEVRSSVGLWEIERWGCFGIQSGDKVLVGFIAPCWSQTYLRLILLCLHK